MYTHALLSASAFFASSHRRPPRAPRPLTSGSFADPIMCEPLVLLLTHTRTQTRVFLNCGHHQDSTARSIAMASDHLGTVGSFAL